MTFTLAAGYVSHVRPSTRVGTYTGTAAACPAGYVSGLAAPARPGRYTDAEGDPARRPSGDAFVAP